jgi:hypothetical protein
VILTGPGANPDKLYIAKLAGGKSIAETVLRPSVLGEDLLQGARGDVGVQGDRLDALLRQVRELPSDVDAQMRTSVLASEAVAEVIEEPGQLRLPWADRVDIHALPSGNPWQGTVSIRRTIRTRSSERWRLRSRRARPQRRSDW